MAYVIADLPVGDIDRLEGLWRELLDHHLDAAPHLAALGAAFGVGANLCFALTGNAAGMFAGQILMGGVWGVFAALGIIVAQRLLPHAVATASAVFMSSTAIASALGGLTGSVGEAGLGLPHVFLAPALYGLIATAGIAVMSRTAGGDATAPAGAQ